MEWTRKEDRVAVIALHRCSHAPTEIFKLLKNLKIPIRFIYRIIKRFREDSRLEDKERSGRPRTVQTSAVIKAVKARIQRNPVRKQKMLALQMGLSRTTVKRLLNEDLGLRAYRKNTANLLHARLKKIRLERSRVLLKRHAGKKYREILFSDEFFFNVEESFIKKNDRVYAHSSEEASRRVPRVQRGHHPSAFMVWLGVSYLGPTEVFFCEKGVKTSALVYQNTVLTNIVEPLSQTMFENRHWIFQQDSAPAHKAKSTQDWLTTRGIDFIRHEDWPSSSPDLNPLDYKIWQHSEEKVCAKPHRNLESLKAFLIKAVADIDMNVVRASIDDWPCRLKSCIEARGGHFE